jgi:hypothetical protein
MSAREREEKKLRVGQALESHANFTRVVPERESTTAGDEILTVGGGSLYTLDGTRHSRAIRHGGVI